MDRCFEYAIARLEANPSRGERLNLAIVVFDEEGLRVHPGRNLEKARAISSALDRTAIEQALANLERTNHEISVQGVRASADRIAALNSLSPIALSSPGRFFAESADAYEAVVRRLVAQLIEPESAPIRGPKLKRTRLLSSVKAAFRSEKVLAKKGETLDSHRIVMNEELAEGLNADMLLKNGAMHIVQTVDASHSERSRHAIQEIGISALVFEQARIRFGADSTRPKLVYAANSQLETSIGPALHAAEHQGADLINWESRDDRVRFVVHLSSLAEPAEPQKRADFGNVTASQRRNLH